MPISKERGGDIRPDKVKLTKLQAERLGAISDIAAKEFAGLTVAEISEKFRYRIDPMLLFFRKVCGQVVKKDPVSGIEYPVPYATVHVEDTDCRLLGYFPPGEPWAWYFPLWCRREEIAAATTDECGNFCVWIPRWDIDWVWHWRHLRICFPIIFERPSIRDILEKVIPERIPFPFPDPDPGPLDRGRLIRLVEDHLGRDVAAHLGRLGSQAAFGTSNVKLTSQLNAPALAQRIPPPLPKELRMAEFTHREAGVAMETARNSLAVRMKLDPKILEKLDFGHFIGPFKRCVDVFIPEWRLFFDVPDITFRVTQDTDGDGDEEVIYSEGFFEVRWNAGTIGPVKIYANPTAFAGLACGGEEVPCGNVPAIVLAGRMPVVDAATIYDHVSGYALRPNRPHPSGDWDDPLPKTDAATPFYGTVSLLGCNKTDKKATHYRVQFKYKANGGASFTDYAPFVGLTWPLFRLDGAGHLEWHYPAADAQGWYPIDLPPGPNPWMPQDLLLDWDTTKRADGMYVLKLELGGGGGVAPTSTSAEVAFHVDNSYPRGPITVEWRKYGTGDPFQPLGAVCPKVMRGATPVDIEFRVTLDAAATHLRSARLYASGCGGGEFELLTSLDTSQHWHTAATDNSVSLVARYRLPSTALQGTYIYSAWVASRAMNPNGGDGGQLILPDPWEYDPHDIDIWPYVAFSVIDHD